jgi:ABC-type polysaccharide/polyol phosphate transport system ATPase subunit
VDRAIELRQVSKRFIIRRNAALNIKVKVVGLFDPRYREYREEFWALRDIELGIRSGEVLGLIGPNGSGKSTLLRLMAGISPPTCGEVIVRGRLAPMIELGVGFHPELTGRENIYLSTSLFALSERETRALVPDIVEFAELEHFIDVPVKNYSTGMYGRLGFAVAVHLDPDILLVDEVLAVGDERFQEKCFQRMEEFRQRGKTMVLVSHDMLAIQRMCDRVCLLVGGHLESEGEPAKVIEHYREVLHVGAHG